jgi:plasmid maintenance system antidote protein VapI
MDLRAWQMPDRHTLWQNSLLNGGRLYIDCGMSSEAQTTSNNAGNTGDLRQALQRELLNRCEKNPQYSLRSFAKSLQMDPSTLSQIIRGKRSITPSMHQKLGLSLGMTPQQLKRLENKSRSGKNAQAKQSLRELSLEYFAVMSDWYHDAILELVRLPHFRGEPKWIAKVLGITVSEVNIAIERLQKLEFLVIHEDGRWENSLKENTTIAHPDLTSVALRKLQKQMLQLSSDTVDTTPKHLRDHTFVLARTDLNDLPEIKDRIKKFRREMMAFAKREGTKPSEVYSLAISLFPISQTSSQTSSKPGDVV